MRQAYVRAEGGYFEHTSCELTHSSHVQLGWGYWLAQILCTIFLRKK